MYKKILCIVFAVAVCLVAAVGIVHANKASAQPGNLTRLYTHFREIDRDRAEAARQKAAAANLDLSLMTIVEDPTYVERMYHVDEEILALPTAELLEYFSGTQLVRETVYQELLSSYLDCSGLRPVDYTLHQAFAELVTREDFGEALEARTDALVQAYNGELGENTTNLAAIIRILGQEELQPLIDAADANPEDYPALQALAAAYLTAVEEAVAIHNEKYGDTGIAANPTPFVLIRELDFTEYRAQSSQN